LPVVAGAGKDRLMNDRRRLIGLLLPAALSASCSVEVDAPESNDELGEIQEALTGTYRLKAAHSGKCMDVVDRSLSDRARVQQWSCSTGTNQQWRLRDLGSGKHELVAVHSGKCMDVAGASTSNGAFIQQYSCASVDQQRFYIESVGSGRYRLRAVHSGKCVDVAGASTADGATVHQWTCNGGANQSFTLEAVSSSSGPLGSGWVQYSPTKKIHLDDEAGLQTFSWTSSKSVCSPSCADYRYDSATDTETFRILDNRSNRSEIRLQNDYSSGSRQFQGYVTFNTPLNDESLMQIFGSTSGATQMMLRGYSANGGEMRALSGTVATGVYGVEQRVNVIHRQGQDIRVYINGSLKRSEADGEAVTNYHKYGCYGTLRTGAATVKWRAVRHYQNGQAP
jgi:hypothetical protein